MLYFLLREFLYWLSRDDAEKAHIAGIELLKWLQRHPIALTALSAWQSRGIYDEEPTTLCGIPLRNRVGIPAGFDKHAEVIPALEALGVGFADIGAILPFAQDGNPRPRVFRLRGGRGVVNRMGFNSVGAPQAKKNWEALQKVNIPIIINVGKMASTPNEAAGGDYESVVGMLAPWGDLLGINVSSPNTAGLRDLQRLIRKLLEGIKRRDEDCRAALGLRPRPLLVKLAPDLTMDERAYIIDESMEGGAQGFILSNTRLAWPEWVRQEYGRDPLLFDQVTGQQRPGGYSGEGSYDHTLIAVMQARSRAPAAGIIASGDVSKPWKAKMLIKEGADAVQLYTPLIRQGPGLIRAIRKELAQL